MRIERIQRMFDDLYGEVFIAERERRRGPGPLMRRTVISVGSCCPSRGRCRGSARAPCRRQPQVVAPLAGRRRVHGDHEISVGVRVDLVGRRKLADSPAGGLTSQASSTRFIVTFGRRPRSRIATWGSRRSAETLGRRCQNRSEPNLLPHRAYGRLSYIASRSPDGTGDGEQRREHSFGRPPVERSRLPDRPGRRGEEDSEDTSPVAPRQVTQSQRGQCSRRSRWSSRSSSCRNRIASTRATQPAPIPACS